MSLVRVPYLKWRHGRPRWEPGPKLRAAGYHGRDLKDVTGQWLEEGPAITEAKRLNAETQQAAPATKAIRGGGRTCRVLAGLWLKSPAFAHLKPKTQRDYRLNLKLFLATPFGDAPVAALTPGQLHGLWEEMYHARGHRMANYVLATISSLLSYAELKDWRPPNSNPAHFERPQPAARLIVFLPAEVEALVADADQLGLHGIGDAIVIALHSGQRPGDVCAMPPRLFDERIRLKQWKRGALIDAPMTEQLATRVRSVRERWRAAGVAARETIVTDGGGRPYITTDATGRVYVNKKFNSEWRRVRDRTAQKFPAVASKNFQDLRDTAVTRLALAGCTMPEIGAITGHSVKTIADVIKHYLVLQPEMADAAISKLELWMKQEGIAL